MIPLQINNSLAEEHYNSVKDIILHHIDRVINNGGIWKRPKSGSYFIPLSDDLKQDLKSLKNNNLILKNLIIGSTSEIKNLVSFYNNVDSNYIDKNENDFKILYNIFVSNGYEDKQFSKWNFIRKINIDTCPYCNRNYIYTTTKNKEIKPEIDHFYPTSKYPIFALSYYNLIPCCKSCNGFGAKAESDPFSENIINPYLIKGTDFVFTHRIKNIAIINPLVGKSDVEINFKNAIKGNLDVFNLKNLYELHHDHALELIIKRRIKYSKKYRDYLNSYNGLKFSKAEIDRMILGNYSLEKDQHKRPLSKLYQDLGKELGLI